VSTQNEDELLRSLLAPLEHAQPVAVGRRRRRRTRTVVVLAAGLAALVLVGLAVAETWNPLAGIGAADRPSRPDDALDADVAAQVRAAELPPGHPVDSIGTRLVGSARLVGQLPSGRNVYVVPTTKGKLCVAVAGRAQSCGEALTRTSPITLTLLKDASLVPPVVYGVAMDGVASVSFTAGEHR
jgi:hypothetical protein